MVFGNWSVFERGMCINEVSVNRLRCESLSFAFQKSRKDPR
jgi:hypothetical protein